MLLKAYLLDRPLGLPGLGPVLDAASQAVARFPGLKVCCESAPPRHRVVGWRYVLTRRPDCEARSVLIFSSSYRYARGPAITYWEQQSAPPPLASDTYFPKEDRRGDAADRQHRPRQSCSLPYLCTPSDGIVAFEEIADGATPKGVPPTPPPMLGSVVHHVTAWTERSEVAPAPPAVGRIVIEMGCREIYRSFCHTNAFERDEYRLATQRSAMAIAPGARIAIPPNAVGTGELGSVETMRTPATLATPLGANEADEVGDLGPVDRVEPAMFRADWHEVILNHCIQERKGKIGPEYHCPHGEGLCQS